MEVPLFLVVLGSLTFTFLIPTIMFPGPFLQWLKRRKYRFEIYTAMYMLNGAEKAILASLIFAVFWLVFIAVACYLPGHLLTVWRRGVYYYSGQHGSHLQPQGFAGHGEADAQDMLKHMALESPASIAASLAAKATSAIVR